MPDILFSVVIPCRNEARHIGPCLDSLLASADLPGKMEIVVVDGLSDDGTAEIIASYAKRYPNIRLLNNPGRIVPIGMNIGIKSATGLYIVRMDAHSEYPSTYVRDCYKLLLKTGAGNAGGRVVTIPNGVGPWAEAVSIVTSSRFGVGNGAFRVGGVVGYVDTVPFGIFKRNIFDEIGYFDERLTRNQDNEFNARIRRSGYKVAFDPSIQVVYKNQPTLAGLTRQAFLTGMWNVYTLRLYPYTFQWRRFVPAVFLGYLILLPLLSFMAGKLASWPVALYAALCVGVSSFTGRGWRGAARVAITFVSYHLCYGAGTIYGVSNLITGKWISFLGKPFAK